MKIVDKIQKEKLDMNWEDNFFAEIVDGKCIAYYNKKFFSVISKIELRKIINNDLK